MRRADTWRKHVFHSKPCDHATIGVLKMLHPIEVAETHLSFTLGARYVVYSWHIQTKC